METPTAKLRVYFELAEWYEKEGRQPMRDRFLILAADAAHAAGRPEDAERCRHRLLQGSRHHMLKPYPSFEAALEAPDVQSYVEDLRVNYPLEVASALLRSLRHGPASTAEQVEVTAPRPAPSTPGRDIPPTAPLIDLPGEGGRRAAEAPGASRRPAPVPASRRTSARPAPPAAPAPPTPPPQSAAPRPAARAASAPLPPSQGPEGPARPRLPSTGGWFAYLLGGLAAGVGAAIAAFTLARPFLPAEWLP